MLAKIAGSLLPIGNQPRSHPEDDEKQDGEPEERHAGAADRHDADDVVGQAVAPGAGIGPQGNAESDGDDAGGDRQLQRGGELVRKHLRDRRSRHARPSEIAAKHAPRPVEILDGQRVVQVKALFDLGDLGRGHLVGEIDADGRAADPGQREHDDGRADDEDRKHHQPPENVVANLHRGGPPVGSIGVRARFIWRRAHVLGLWRYLFRSANLRLGRGQSGCITKPFTHSRWAIATPSWAAMIHIGSSNSSFCSSA